MPIDQPTSSDRHAAERRLGQSTAFQRSARALTSQAGSGYAAVVVLGLGVAWLLAGWVTGFPRSWEIAGTGGTPFLTLLMVVVLQHTQNHDSLATQLKLDEIIRASRDATNQMMTVEDASADDLARIHESFRDHAEREPSS